MASSSSGRYQSRLFNWLSQGLGQFEKLQPHIRRLKTGVAWGVQVVFYWAYHLIQTAQSTGPRLGRVVQQQLGTDTTPPASQPIQQILLEVSYMSLETSDSVLASREACDVPIQGIASLLTTRTLVLVTEQNQPLEILTPDQQKQLHCRIIQALDSWHQVRITQATRRRLNPLLALGQVVAAWPKRLAQPIIARLQPQPTVPATNPQPQELSPDSKLTANSESQIQSSKSKIGKALTFLDSISLQLEQRAKWIIRWARQVVPFQNSLDQQASRDKNLNIQALIRAAIAYFFGRKPLKSLSDSSTQAAILDSGVSSSGSQKPSSDLRQPSITGSTNQPRIKPGQAEPWLTLADLFGGSAKAIASSGSGVASMSTTSQSEKLGNSASASVTDAHTQVPQSYSAADASWVDLEIEAILMGYEKHPLEQVLEWLDRGLAWLEELVIAIWTSLRPYLSALFQLIQRYWRR